MGEKHVMCKSFQILSRKKCMSVPLNILCPVCISLHYMWNYAGFDKNSQILSN